MERGVGDARTDRWRGGRTGRVHFGVLILGVFACVCILGLTKPIPKQLAAWATDSGNTASPSQETREQAPGKLDTANANESASDRIEHSPLPPAPLPPSRTPQRAELINAGSDESANESAKFDGPTEVDAEEAWERELSGTDHLGLEDAEALASGEQHPGEKQQDLHQDGRLLRSRPTAGPATAGKSTANGNGSKRADRTGQAARAIHEAEESKDSGVQLSSGRTEGPNSTRLAKLFRGSPPVNREELKTLQARIRELTPRIIPSTVAIQVGRANGSGVIIDAEGHVLTAAHVAGTPGRRATIYLADGKAVAGTTLGMNQKLDAGMIKITEEGPWPHVPLGRSADVRDGQWCLATGHPGGYDPDRQPVLRWGRVLKTDESAILSDCTLVGGDSGGPLFDLQGRVIGIHSRIGKNLTINVHVPIDPYRESWDRLVRSETWGPLEEDESGDGAGAAWLGVVENPRASGATIEKVAPGSPAAEAGILAGDRITQFNDQEVESFEDLQKFVRESSPGSMVRVRLARDNDVVDLQLTLAARPDASAD